MKKIKRLVKKYVAARDALVKERDKMFPIGCKVDVISELHGGLGVVSFRTAHCPDDHIPVMLKTDRIWFCPVVNCTPVPKKVAWYVEVNGVRGVCFAETAAKARWQAVKSYREAYGSGRGEWSALMAWRVEKYDRKTMRHTGHGGFYLEEDVDLSASD